MKSPGFPSRISFTSADQTRKHHCRLEEDWEQMQKAVSEWNSEAKRSTSHLPVNFEILLKQASVLQGLCLGDIHRFCGMTWGDLG
jgi:hypothetical protein